MPSTKIRKNLKSRNNFKKLKGNLKEKFFYIKLKKMLQENKNSEIRT